MRLLIRDLAHWKFKYDALRLGVLTLVVILLWVSIELYLAYTRTTISSDLEPYLEPLNPSLDIDLITGLSDRFVPPAEFSILTISEEDGLVSREVVVASESSELSATESGISQ